MDDTKPNSKDGGEEFDLKILLDSSYPLLKKFRDACPGTFKHCQSVVSMIEGISLTLDLNVTEMKIMAQYHDIGKMSNPQFFTENQLDEENPHSALKPEMSFQIISRHVSDTVLLLVSDENFPKHIINKLSQHHGTTIMRDFYDTAKNVDENTNENSFRYISKKPSSVEAMLLMICDNIEAMSRSYIQHGKEFDPSSVIEDAISRLMSDGQLDALTLGELRKIKKALAKELEGTYQKRISYDINKEKTEDLTGEI